MKAIAADIDKHNFRVWLDSLDIDRSVRIYKSLADLSTKAVDALQESQSQKFSEITDIMRPLIGYVTDNQVKLSRFLDHEGVEKTELDQHDPEILTNISTFRKNLKTIDHVRNTMNAVPFSPVFFLSRELTNAFIDYQLSLAWDFEHDAVIILNSSDIRLIEALLERGQKRFIFAGGSLDNKDFQVILEKGGAAAAITDYKPLLEAGGVPQFYGRPANRFVIFDVGEKQLDDKVKKKIAENVVHERNSTWARFNTVNRADATRVLPNLGNMALFDETSVLHNKFKGRAAIVVSPGPSLEKNVDLLKKVRGKVLVICVLHAFKELQRRGIIPDIVIHIDPADLKTLYSRKNDKKVSHWEEWIEDNDFKGVSHLIVSNLSAPNMYNLDAKKTMWMSPGLPIGEYLPEKSHDYTRIGGSVSHAAFDLAVEFGCSSIALIGQDLARSIDGDLYAKNADLKFNEEEEKEEKRRALGADVEVKGYYGDTVLSNNTFVYFRRTYEEFAEELKGTEIKVFNCTEGGAFINGFKHITLKKFIEEESQKEFDESISEILQIDQQEPTIKLKRIKKTQDFIRNNNGLCNEIDRQLKKLIPLAQKNNISGDDLTRFDTIQNKMIKKMKKNIFYSLGLQRDIHILQSGLRTDTSLEGQLGYHLDFLRVVQNLNDKFKKSFSEQLLSIKSEQTKIS